VEPFWVIERLDVIKDGQASLVGGKEVALTVQYRFIHLSDRDITRPNQGVNESTFSGGVSWFFEIA
jgi:hypothetical protein